MLVSGKGFTADLLLFTCGRENTRAMKGRTGSMEGWNVLIPCVLKSRNTIFKG